MGAVYNATHTGLEKPVVVKVLRPEWASNVDVRARFVREGRAAAAIRHPHVVDVTDVGELDGTPYLVMERLVGETLTALIARGPGLPPELAVDVLLPVCAAVDAAHAAGVVHRDLKPDNLFVTRTPSGEVHPKVLDFGISRVTGDGGQTGTTATLGTPAYMAPEQIVSSRDANALSDQYALGVILYECLTGRQAFKAENIYVVLRMVGDGVFTPPRALQPVLPPDLEAVVLRAMAREPGQRFPSLKAFAAALLPWASMRAR
jgi:serine/threonine-protein kinase